MSAVAVILAGGSGERFQGSMPKQFLKIAGRSLLQICLEQFQGHSGIDGIVLVCPAAQLDLAGEMVATACISKVQKILPGGKTRQESSFIGVSAVPPGIENILIHDAVRALVPDGIIARVLEALAHSRAVMPVLAVSDTTIRIDKAGVVAAVLDRSILRLVQTPQGFRLEIIHRAHELARAEGYSNVGDDCSLVLRYMLAPVVTVPGDPTNIKITYPLDLAVAEAILRWNW
ncbi:MAG: 2-C-methyl-D-erythritol 4-phosphate cytidylyltransferase [Chrysiogenales bacterium]